MDNQELAHFGVKGMRWGHRKNNYVTVRQGLKNARSAGQEAWRKSVSDNGGKLVGRSKQLALYKNPADKFRGKKAARDAYNNAQKESLKNDKAYNRQIRAENKTSNPNRNREIAIATTAVVGTALVAYGAHKVSNAIKNNAFKHSMDQGMSCAKRLIDNGRTKIALETLSDSYSHHGESTISAIRRTISNNEVRGKVDWKNVAKTLMG